MTGKLKEVDQRIQDLTLFKRELEQLERSLAQGENEEEQEDHTVVECLLRQCFGDSLRAKARSQAAIKSQKIWAKGLDIPATG